MFDPDFGSIEQFVGFADGSNCSGWEVLSFQGDYVDAPWSCRETFGEHEGWYVLENA